MKRKQGITKAGLIGLCIVLIMGMVTLTGCGDGALPYSQYDLDEYIKVSDYKGLSVDGYSISISDKDVQAKVLENLKNATENQELENGTEIVEGDTVNIDYVGRVDGKKFDGGSAQGQDLVIGSGQFIDGFESGLIGKKVGDKNIKLPVTFPEEYQSEELEGKDAVFTVTINSATREIIPEYNQAFIKSQGDYKNKKEYEKAVKKKLYKQKEEAAKNKQKTKLWDKVLTKSKAKKYPQDEVNLYVESNSKQIDSLAEEYGISRQEVLSKYGYPDEKTFDASNEESSKLRVKQEMIIMKIAEDEGLSFTNEAKEEMVQQLEKQGYTDESVKEQTGRSMDEYVSIQLLFEQVLDLILDEAKVKK